MSMQTLKSGWLLRESSVLKRWKRNWFVLYADGNFAYYEDESKRERHGNFNIPGDCKSIKTALECEASPPEGRNYGCLIKLVSRHGSDLVIASANMDEAMAWKMTLEQLVVVSPPVRQVVHSPRTTYSTTVYPCGAVRAARYPYRTFTTTTYYPAQQPVTYPVGPQPNPGAVQRGSKQYPVQQQSGPPPYSATSNGQQYQVQQPMYYDPNYHTAPVHVLYNSAGQPYYVHPNTQVVTVIRDNDPYYYRRGDMFMGMAAGAMLGAALWTPFLFF